MIRLYFQRIYQGLFSTGLFQWQNLRLYFRNFFLKNFFGYLFDTTAPFFTLTLASFAFLPPPPSIYLQSLFIYFLSFLFRPSFALFLNFVINIYVTSFEHFKGTVSVISSNTPYKYPNNSVMFSCRRNQQVAFVQKPQL